MKFKQRLISTFTMIVIGLLALNVNFVENDIAKPKTEEEKPIDSIFDYGDPKIVRSSLNVDKNQDKIADSLSILMHDLQQPNFDDKTSMFDDEDTTRLDVMICLTEAPNAIILNKLQRLGVEITSSFNTLVYAVGATVPIENIPLIAAEDHVVLIEKQAKSSALLDTSTVNMGVRGSPYVWDAPSTIKGNSSYSIAILDTGVDSSHADMENFIYFQDFSDEAYPSGPIGFDYDHHGTHCASIAAGTGSADIDPDHVNQTISNTFSIYTVGSAIITDWFEVKDNQNTPNTSVTVEWDTSNSGECNFGIRDAGETWIVSYEPYTSSPISLNVGNLSSGWYQVICSPAKSNTLGKDYTIKIQQEYHYELMNELSNSPVFAGVAPQSNIISLKVLNDTGVGDGEWFINALEWISANGKDPAYNITVVSMSLGFNGIYSSLDNAVNNLVSEGFICVAAAGNGGTNSGENSIFSPGSASKCITVGAVNDAFEVTYYSSNGDSSLNYAKPDVVAPGGTVALDGSNAMHNLILAADSNDGESQNNLGDTIPDDYVGMQGTSMACPHIAGLAQLVIDAIVQDEGSWPWTEDYALKVKQRICMGTWEVNAGETFEIPSSDDGLPQTSSLNRIESDYVEGYGMTRADAVIQSITHPTEIPMISKEFYLDRRAGFENESKVFLFSFEAVAGQMHYFNLNVPSTGDFDLIIYDKNYNSTSGRPVVVASSITNGLDNGESISFLPDESGTYFWSIRAVEGYGLCQMSITMFDDTDAPQWKDLTLNADPSELGELQTISIKIIDNIAVDHVWMTVNSENNTLVQGIDNIYEFSWVPPYGVNTYYISMVDTSGNFNMTPTFSFTVSESTIPTWDEIPTNQTLGYGFDFSYDLNASDNIAIDHYWISDTVNFHINAMGIITNLLALESKDYEIEIRAYDPNDNFCSAMITITVGDPPSKKITGFPTLYAISLGAVYLFYRKKNEGVNIRRKKIN